MSKQIDISRYAQMGIAATLPGLVRAVEVLQEEIDTLRGILTAAQQQEQPRTVGRPKMLQAVEVLHERITLEPEPQRRQQVKSFWARLTPEERRAEMQRRYNVRLAKEGKPPRFGTQPVVATPSLDLSGAKAVMSALKTVQQQTQAPPPTKKGKKGSNAGWWASLSPSERAAHAAKAAAGYKKSLATKRRLATLAKKKQLVNGHAAGVQAQA